jgi:hypothetical protein
MNPTAVIQSITTLFSEVYAGPANPRSTWFIDNEPDSGILGLIEKISAKEASLSTNRNQPGTTIAAHIEHLRWSLANANSALQGQPYQGNWSESWNTLEADEAKWEYLRSNLKQEFELLRENLQKQTELSGDYLTGVMALVPHAAYHLATIRQLIERAHQEVSSTNQNAAAQ